MKTETISALLRLVRPHGSVMLGFAVLVGEVIGIGRIPQAEELMLGFLAGFFLASASFVINDYVDIKIDRINVPGRPVASGIISRRAALQYSLILSALGLLTSLLTSVVCMLIALVMLLIATLYSVYLKRMGFVGNVTVAFLVAISIPYGAILTSGTVSPLVAVVFLLAFLANTGREITQSIMDMDGDRVGGIRSLPIVRGPRYAASVASIFYLSIAVAPLLLLNLIGETHQAGIILLSVALVGLVWCSIMLVKNPTRDVASKVRIQAELLSLVVMVALFVIGLSPLS